MGNFVFSRISAAGQKHDQHPSTFLWHNNRIPYQIDPTSFPANSPQLAEVVAGIALWNASGFVQLTAKGPKDGDFAIFHSGVGCSSNVGRVGGPQVISCDTASAGFGPGSVAHEIGHALGMVHEHQRVDRNVFVHVNPLVAGDINYSQNLDSVAVGSYDCGSIMHYPSVTGKLTIKSPECSAQLQHDKISAGDRFTARVLQMLSVQMRRQTRISCAAFDWDFEAAGRTLRIGRGFCDAVNVNAPWQEIAWWCGGKHANKRETISFDPGASYIVVVRFQGTDYANVYRY
jgi:Astacin (Peptidase family M12A)